MRRSSVFLFVPALVTLFLSSALRAQDQAAATPSWTLDSVRATGPSRFSDAQILDVSGLKIGSRVDKSNLDDAANRLLVTGAFSKVGYNYQTRGDKLAVTFQVSDAARFLPCIFDNFVWFSDDELVRTVQKSVPFFDGSLPDNGGLADDVASALDKMLAVNGIAGRATYLRKGNLGQAATAIIFEVQGAVPTVSAVQFTNGPLDPPLFAEGSKLLLGKPYSRTLAEDVANNTFTAVYANRGYLRAKFAEPKLSVHAGGAPGDPGTVALSFSVDAGTQFHWAGLTWSGNQVLSEKDLSPLVTLKNGDVADANKISDVWTAVQDLYGHSGYLTAGLRPEPQFDDSSAQVRYSVAITEGPQYRMGNLTVDAVTSDLAPRLRAAWELKQGDVFDTRYMKNYIQAAGKIVARAGVRGGAQFTFSERLVPQTQTVDVLLTYK